MSAKKKRPEEKPLAATLVTTGYIVVKGERPCTLVNVTGTHKGGLLMPGAPVVAYAKPRDARRAIDRTKRVAQALRGTLIDSWERLQPLFSPGEYKIEPIARQT